ncbi:MAG: hypothetical protein J6S75_14870, partial [Thermoguttaceae bacterium]|nr:hypothetical protein [Thermoguttaceae bacterium]
MSFSVRTIRKTALWALPLVLCAVMAGAPRAEEKAAVSLPSLLTEMLDRSTITHVPDPWYTCRQASSYDRASVSPEEGWFANDDCSQFLRQEERTLPDGAVRKEWVLMDAAGPGAIVRFWITAPQYVNNLYFYIDGAEEPVIAGPSDQIIGGAFLAGEPLSQETARGRNLYLPIPYAKSIKVTCDKIDTQPAFYYQINYRTYAEGTEVESFSADALAAAADTIAETNAALADPSQAYRRAGTFHEGTVTLAPGQNMIFQPFYGPGCITEVTAKLKAGDCDDPSDPKVVQALRSLVFSVKFDGRETV